MYTRLPPDANDSLGFTEYITGCCGDEFKEVVALVSDVDTVGDTGNEANDVGTKRDTVLATGDGEDECL